MNDHILHDLGAKCGHDVSTRVQQTASLLETPEDRLYAALCGVASAAGLAVGFAQQCAGSDDIEEATDALWTVLRPMIVLVAGGGSADFRKLLRQAPKARHRKTIR